MTMFEQFSIWSLQANVPGAICIWCTTAGSARQLYIDLQIDIGAPRSIATVATKLHTNGHKGLESP
jgi:hypothetical protein